MALLQNGNQVGKSCLHFGICVNSFSVLFVVDKFNARSSLLYSSSAESGLDGNVDEVRASKTPSR